MDSSSSTTVQCSPPSLPPPSPPGKSLSSLSTAAERRAGAAPGGVGGAAADVQDDLRDVPPAPLSLTPPTTYPPTNQSARNRASPQTLVYSCVGHWCPVDSVLVRQLVTEVLSEQIALLLGERDPGEPEPETRPEPGAGPEPRQQDSGPLWF
ncbi:hypothetical protein JOQ06_029608 [Pogonophryne albipinna]|uniref:Uncharacterized protein n=1 Tax=Pogonophryne albipinna TaxID=1090488 RepID=A0AAD6A519_9TELE|nr:hypothetical protein JOQ06_029608 [Pogonophryne albipinna]